MNALLHSPGPGDSGATNGSPVIRLENVEVRYGRKPPVLSVEELIIRRGETVAVVGPSGAGKSTLLRAIKGYVRPALGKVEVMGVNLAVALRKQRNGVNQRVALIYQQFYLAKKLSVLRNVLCGRLGMTSRWRSLLGMFSEEDKRIAWSAICEVGLRELVHQRADTLSGGEQQRVAVARALAQQPAILLADEPVSSLDPAWAQDVIELILEVRRHHEATLLMSLHQPILAKRYFDRILGLKRGQLVFDGPPDEFTKSRMEDLYRGDESIHLDAAAGRPGSIAATSA